MATAVKSRQPSVKAPKVKDQAFTSRLEHSRPVA